MEATSPKYRMVPVFEYGIGWGLGVLLTPLLNSLTRDYRLFLACLLVFQLVMIPWLHWGVFESIRWLLSEGHINRAQIELRRACRFNRVKTGARLAQNIAQIQVQQVRKASCVIDQELAPARLAKALESQVDLAAQELDMLSAAIKKSFGFCDDLDDGDSLCSSTTQPQLHRYLKSRTTSTVSLSAPTAVGSGGADNISSSCSDQQIATLAALSPTLARKSFSLARGFSASMTSEVPPSQTAKKTQTNENHKEEEEANTRQQVVALPPLSSPACAEQQVMAANGDLEAHRKSFTTQGLIELAMKYSKTVQQQEEGSCFLVQMFHPKLYKQSLVLMAISLMLETSYYGLIQANKFVGSNVDMNYVIGAFVEWAAACIACALLAVVSRRTAINGPIILASIACFGMALSYQLIPDHQSATTNSEFLAALGNDEQQASKLAELIEHRDNLDAGPELTNGSRLVMPHQSQHDHAQLIELRHQINLWLMNIGKLAIVVAIQVAATIAMEAYPSNLRQTGSGVIVLVGRVGSIVAPFLFNDQSEHKLVFKLTLTAMAAIGIFVSLIVPCTLEDNKDKELCDRLNEIEESH